MDTKTVLFTVALSEPLHTMLRKLAEQEKRSTKAQAELLLIQKLEELKAGK